MQSSSAYHSSFEVEDGGVDEQVVVSKVNRNLVTLLWSLAIVCYLDRTNLSFAALQMNRDLNLSCSVYGFGAGIFFISYALFQPISNLILARVGAPRWLSATVVAWGVVAASMSLINGPTAYLLLRFALGMTEASTFPGIWAQLARFFTSREMNSAYAYVATATALAQVIGAPIAAAILLMDGLLGIAGWKWLFIIEGSVTVMFGVVLAYTLPASPSDARFLTPAERAWLQRRQDAQPHAADSKGTARTEFAAILRVFRNWRVLYLSSTLLCIQSSMFSILFFAPMMIHQMDLFSSPAQRADAAARSAVALAPAGESGASVAAAKSCSGEGGGGSGSGAAVALLSMLPFAAAAAAMVLNAKHAEARNERHLHAGLAVALGSLFMALTPVMLAYVAPFAAYACLVVAAAAVWAFHGPFMSWPAAFLTGPDAAAGFAAMNCLGSLGGVLGPSLLGFLKDRFDSYAASMGVLSGLLALASVGIMLFPVPPAEEPAAVTILNDDEIWAGGELMGSGKEEPADTEQRPFLRQQ